MLLKLLDIHSAIALSIPLLERGEIIKCLAQWKREKNQNCYLYNIGSGWQIIDKKYEGYLQKLKTEIDWTQGLLHQLNKAMQEVISKKQGLFILENIPSYLKQAQGLEKQILFSCIQNLIWTVRNNGKTLIVFLDCNENSIDSSLQSIIPQFYYPLPNSDEIIQILKTGLSDYISDIPLSMLSSVSGLSPSEIKIGISLVKSNLKSQEPTAEYLAEELLNYKKTKLATLGLEFIVPDVKDFGGLDRIKLALESVKLDFSPEAKKLGLPLPKGWILVGPPGTGKTFSAKVCAAKLGFPLISIGIDKVKSGGVDKLKQLLYRVEAAAPAIVYFDEFDKFFAVDTRGSTASEQQSVLGVLLTWLQEKQSDTFVIASLNRLDALPPEITRAGRFDKLFYCGFPQASERVEILKIHCSRFDRRWINPPISLEQWRVLLQKTQNCTGAELRAIVENAARQLFREGKSLQIEVHHLLEQRALMTPLYYRDIDRILAIENRAKAVCEPASSLDTSKYAPPEVSLWGEKSLKV